MSIQVSSGRGDAPARWRDDAPARSGFPGSLPALVAVLDDARASGVAHCSWKSNEHLEAALAGETDLDLLVDRDSAAAFRSIVDRHGLKRLEPPPAAVYPGMEHYLGCDPGSRRLFHLHVHYQLVLGERDVKNYRLPIERRMLVETRQVHGLVVPRPELELAVLVVRILLKYRARDAVKDCLRIRTPGVHPRLMTELRWLLEQTNTRAVRRALAGDDVISADLVGDFLDTLAEDPRAGLTLLRLRARARAELGRFARVSRPVAVLTALTAAAGRRKRRRRGTLEPRMTMATGGSSIALVGADGSGKSTIAHGLAEWYGWKVETRVHYLGSKPPSRASRSAYLAFRATRRGERGLAAVLGADATATRWVSHARDAMFAAYHLSTAHQRARAYAAARRDVSEGRVVVFDRFPASSIGGAARTDLLDGPRIAAATGRLTRPVVRQLARAEARTYSRFDPPDALVVLDVDADVAAARKPDHDRTVVAEKVGAVSALAHQSPALVPHTVVVDANRPLGLVLDDVKQELWHVS